MIVAQLAGRRDRLAGDAAPDGGPRITRPAHNRLIPFSAYTPPLDPHS